jgi:hypothetical protein
MTILVRFGCLGFDLGDGTARERFAVEAVPPTGSADVVGSV